MKQQAFDSSYYKRFYGTKKTQVHGLNEIGNLASGVVGFMRWYGVEPRSVLDVGAGLGLWRDWFRKNMPKTRYRSFEVSEFACDKYGHEQGDLAKLLLPEKFDLIVCQGVLQYMNDASVKKGIANLGKMSKGFLYLEAITTRDVREVCDRELTDLAIHVRPGAFYRKLLARHFEQLGAGLFHAKTGPAVFYELEQPK